MQAEAWWQQHEPRVLLRETEAASYGQAPAPAVSTTDLTRADSNVATFGASELEAVSQPGSSDPERVELSLSLGDDEPRPERA